MDNKRATRIVAGLVAVPFVLFITAHYRLALDALSASSFPAILCLCALFMLSASQGALLALWLVLGGGKLRWRLAVLVLGALVYWCCFPYPYPYAPMVDWLCIACGELGVCTAMLLVARWTGLRLVRLTNTRMRPGPFQFYIRDILVWTTACAVFLSVWYSVPADDFSPQALGVQFVCFTLVAGVSTFSTLGQGWIVARIVRLPLVVGFAAVLLTKALGGGFPWPWWYFAMPLTLMALWLVASFLVLRVAGYRLAWRPGFEQPPEQPAT
jgi:hypothetical protein